MMSRVDVEMEIEELTAERDKLLEDRAKLIEALRQIYDNSNEENEWDAVDKLHYNERLAGTVLASLQGEHGGKR